MLKSNITGPGHTSAANDTTGSFFVSVVAKKFPSFTFFSPYFMMSSVVGLKFWGISGVEPGWRPALEREERRT